MTSPAAHVNPFLDQSWDELETHIDGRLSAAAGLLGIAIIEVEAGERETAVERLVEHLDGEDHTARPERLRLVVVRCPLTGPAEMEGLGLRIADSFPPSAVHIGVVTGRCGDKADTLIRHARYSLDDAKVIGRAIIPIDDAPRLLDTPG